MKGKISKTGELLIKRGNEYKEQWCSENADQCCDACPWFGEILEITTRSQYTPIKPADKYQLSLCKKILYFEELIDERENSTACFEYPLLKNKIEKILGKYRTIQPESKYLITRQAMSEIILNELGLGY